MGALPDVLWDGFSDPAKQIDGATPAALRVCVDNEGAEVINVDAPQRLQGADACDRSGALRA